MRALREFLGLNQTRFGSLLGLSQPDVSNWESPDKRDVPLPGKHAKLFLDVWDCFPEPPHGGFNEIMAAFAAYQNRNAPSVNRNELVKLVPERAVSAVAPEIYWAPKENPPSASGKVPAPSPGSSEPESADTEQAGQRDILRTQLTILGLSILFAVWMRARRRHGDSAPRLRPAFIRWSVVAPLLAFVLATGCFQAHREASREQPAGMSANREPLKVPIQIYADAKKQAGGADAPKSSIPMPDKPYSWQRTSPCDPGMDEMVGGCWLAMDPAKIRPPCPDVAVESGNKCYVPVPAKPKEPNTINPTK